MRLTFKSIFLLIEMEKEASIRLKAPSWARGRRRPDARACRELEEQGEALRDWIGQIEGKWKVEGRWKRGGGTVCGIAAGGGAAAASDPGSDRGTGGGPDPMGATVRGPQSQEAVEAVASEDIPAGDRLRGKAATVVYPGRSEAGRAAGWDFEEARGTNGIVYELSAVTAIDAVRREAQASRIRPLRRPAAWAAGNPSTKGTKVHEGSPSVRLRALVC
ncbi:MAG TPA: hypothetical protein P5300_03895 [Acidobacteriota bacterium]|nr:hypothetical protein [Acidobacteriota bacterium]